MKRILRIVGGVLLGVFIAISTTGCTSDKPKEVTKVEQETKVEKPKIEVEKPVSELKNDNMAEAEYLLNFAVIMTDTGIAMGDISDSFAMSSQDVSLLTDKQWRQDIVDAYAVISKNHKELMGMEVPPRLQEIHDLSIKGFEKFIESRNRILQGVDTQDAKHLIEGVKLMEEGTLYFEQVNEKIEELKALIS